MASKDVVQLNRADFLAALVDQLFDPASDGHVAIFVLLSLVSGSEEAALGERRLVGLRVVQIALRDVLAADADLGFGPFGDFVSLAVEDPDFDSLPDTHTAWSALSGWKRVGCHLVRGFSHGIGFKDGGVVLFFQQVERRGR